MGWGIVRNAERSQDCNSTDSEGWGWEGGIRLPPGSSAIQWQTDTRCCFSPWKRLKVLNPTLPPEAPKGACNTLLGVGLHQLEFGCTSTQAALRGRAHTASPTEEYVALDNRHWCGFRGGGDPAKQSQIAARINNPFIHSPQSGKNTYH